MNSHPDPGQRTAYGRRTRPPAPSPDWPAPPAAPFTTGRPRLIGIVNITEDSFSDGGCYLAPAAASHPGSAPVDPAKEERRLAPVLDQLTADGIPVSVDSFQPKTQQFAISH